MWAYAVATFTGAVLLFEVEPLVGKYVLPWFGGAPSVWTTCLMFFQVSLLAGYAYAHLLSKLATYCRPGDYLRIYEINPEVERLALSTFKYLSNCAGKVELVDG